MENNRFGLVVLAVGLGKSWVMVGIAEYFKRVVVLQPCLELVKQNHSKLDGLGFDTAMIDSAHAKKNWGAEFIYTTPQSLVKNLDKIQEPDLLIIDECFTGDTMIHTPDGDVRIDSIKCGDNVLCASGVGKVVNVIKKTTNKLYKVRLNNGKIIKGTGNHPIFTERGWVRLDHLEKWENVFSVQDMPNLWEKVSTNGQSHKRGAVSNKEVLQSILFKERQPSASVKNNKTKRSRNEFETWRQEVLKSWRKWSTVACSSDRFMENPWRRLVLRICNKNRTQSMGWKRLSHLLQSRYRKPYFEDRNRDRRAESSLCSRKNERQKERGFFTNTWVEDIQVEEQRMPVPVYNLQVSGHPSYFANGVLVHNCNVFYDGKLFDQIFSVWKHCKVAGFTATPYYYKRKTVYKNGWMCNQTTIVSIEEQYGHAVINIDREQGHALGYSPEIKMRKVNIVPLTSDHLDNPVVYEKIINEHLHGVSDLCKTLHNGIIYCDSITHAELLSKVFNIPTVFGSTPKKRRVDLIERFLQGRIPFLLTVGCLVRGFDRQDLENIILLTNFNNSCELEQVVGRLNRGTCNKTCWYNRRINTKKPVPGTTEIIKIKKL